MIDRREILRGVALATALTAAQSVSACSLAEYDDDNWGDKLIDFFQTGSALALDDLFRDFTTLVTFDETFGVAPTMVFRGKEDVKSALVMVRGSMTRKLWVEPRKLVDAKIVGSKQQGRMSRIELMFAEGRSTETSCGPDRGELRADLYYQAGVYDTGEDCVKWGIERLALMPPLETERFGF